MSGVVRSWTASTSMKSELLCVCTGINTNRSRQSHTTEVWQVLERWLMIDMGERTKNDHLGYFMRKDKIKQLVGFLDPGRFGSLNILMQYDLDFNIIQHVRNYMLHIWTTWEGDLLVLRTVMGCDLLFDLLFTYITNLSVSCIILQPGNIYFKVRSPLWDLRPPILGLSTQFVYLFDTNVPLSCTHLYIMAGSINVMR